MLYLYPSMKRLVWVCIALVLLSFSGAKEFVLIKKVALDASILTTDNMGNCFVASNNGDIIKYNRNGDSLTLQNYKAFGELSSIDASNPFEIYLYYQDLNSLVFVDNMLTNRGEMDLEDLGLENVSAAARSWDNGVWLYDLSTNRLKKINKNKELVLETPPSTFYTDEGIEPFQIIDNQTEVFVCDSTKGIFVFDNFGTFSRRIDLLSTRPLQLIGEDLIYYADSTYQTYSIKSFKNSALELPNSKNVQCLRLVENRVAILTNKSLTLYSHKKH